MIDRLFVLNAERAAEERALGLVADKKKKPKKAEKKRDVHAGQGDLFASPSAPDVPAGRAGRMPALPAVPAGHMAGRMPALPAALPAGPAGDEARAAVVEFLAAQASWCSRAGVLASVPLTTGEWNRVIGELVESGEVERTGEKRGTRYRHVSAAASIDEDEPAVAAEEDAELSVEEDFEEDEDFEEGEDPGRIVLSWLEDHPGWHARADILAEVALTAGEWNQVIADLMASGEVERTGEKRGTRYRYPGDVSQWVSDWFSENPGWHARADVMDALEIDVGDWNRAIERLLESGEVERTGEKRGTRYRWRGDDRSLVAWWFAEHPGWHSRQDVLEDLEIDTGSWNRAIRELMESEEVVRKGEKRGTRYCWWEHEERTLF